MLLSCSRGCWIAALFMAATVGCSSNQLERVALRGGVQFGSDMLASGRIHFIPTGATKGPAATAVIRDGFYEFDRRTGPLVGTHRVEIESQPQLGFALDDEAAFAAAAVQMPRNKPVLPKDPIPARYNRRSELTATIQRGQTAGLDFFLEPPAVSAR
ncbi:MAG TPA: hypothetical protein VFG20_03010 [Planctomycetaceae bacterium]|nr:hypothetical protein [Planctomycetaceae bacterium]